jgi:hypothetical protein
LEIDGIDVVVVAVARLAVSFSAIAADMTGASGRNDEEV